MKDADDELKIVIVCDMWLTGFDVPCLHTMYLDKPMSGHHLMQAIARVNRVFKDKPGGLVVDYIGIADNLRSALIQYSPRTERQRELIRRKRSIFCLKNVSRSGEYCMGWIIPYIGRGRLARE